MLLKQTLFYMPAQLIGPLSQFVAAIVWTHLLSLDEYGHLMIVLAAQELISLVCLSWWTHYAMRYVGAMRGTDGRQRYQASENRVLIVTGLAEIGATLAMVASFVSMASTSFMAAAILLVLSRTLVTHLAERARVEGDIIGYSQAQIIGPLGGMLLGFAFMALADYDPPEAMLGYAVAQIVSIVIVWMRLGLKPVLAGSDGAMLKAAFVYGLPLLAAGALGWVSINGIRLVVEQMEGAAAVGLLSVGWGLGQRAVGVVAMLVTAAAYPLALRYMHAGAREKSLEQVSLNGALIFGVLAPAAVGILMVGRTFVDLLVAQEFREMAIIILPLAVVASAIRNFRVHFLDQVLLLVERPRQLLVINFVEGIATLLFCAIGLELYGLPGAAAGCIPGALLGLAHSLVLSVRHGLKLPLAHLARIGSATLVMFAALALFPEHETVLRLALEIGTGAIVYVVMIGLFYFGDIRQFRMRSA